MFIQLKKSFSGRPAGERIDVSDNEGKLLVEQGVAEAVPANDVVNQLMAKAMESAMGRLSDTLGTTVDAALKEFADAQSQARRHASRSTLARIDAAAMHCERASP